MRDNSYQNSPFSGVSLGVLGFPQRVMKSRRDDASKLAAKVAGEAAAGAMQYAEEAIRRSEAQDDEQEDDGPTKCFAIFKAEGFGMLEAMSQVGACEGCRVELWRAWRVEGSCCSKIGWAGVLANARNMMFFAHGACARGYPLLTGAAETGRTFVGGLLLACARSGVAGCRAFFVRPHALCPYHVTNSPASFFVCGIDGGALILR